MKEKWGLESTYLYDKGYDWIVGIVFGWVHALKDASLARRSDRHDDGVFGDYYSRMIDAVVLGKD